MRIRSKIIPVFFNEKSSKIFNLASIVTRTMLGRRFSIYTGCSFLSLLIRDYHLGFRIGSFVKTKRIGSGIHKKKEKKKKK